MNDNLNISSDFIKVDEIVSNCYCYISFTLTARAVNDAPVLLQSFEDLEILGDSGAAAVVLYTILGDVFHLIYCDNMYLHNFLP